MVVLKKVCFCGASNNILRNPWDDLFNTNYEDRCVIPIQSITFADDQIFNATQSQTFFDQKYPWSLKEHKKYVKKWWKTLSEKKIECFFNFCLNYQKNEFNTKSIVFNGEGHFLYGNVITAYVINCLLWS